MARKDITLDSLYYMLIELNEKFLRQYRQNDEDNMLITLRLYQQEVASIKRRLSDNTDIQLWYKLGEIEGTINGYIELFKTKTSTANIDWVYNNNKELFVKIAKSLDAVSPRRMNHNDLADSIGISYGELTEKLKHYILHDIIDYSGSGRRTSYKLSQKGEDFCIKNSIINKK